MKKEIEIPRYITIGKNGTAMKRTGSYKNGRYEYTKYWRDAGHWGLSAKVVNGKLLCAGKGSTKHLNKIELLECSHEHWMIDNTGYIGDQNDR